MTPAVAKLPLASVAHRASHNPPLSHATDALCIRALSKRFGGVLALDNVSLSIRRGEVHGLLGSNGSGKSTLIKVLSGFHYPEPGAEIQLYGHSLPLPIKSAQLMAYGLSFVHQHLGLVPTLSVTENLYLGRIASKNNWRINWRLAHENARSVFERFQLKLEPTLEVGRLSAVEQALLAIVRAYETLQDAQAEQTDRPGVLVLDEPTPFLPQAGVTQLFELIKQCVATGASVIFVSHDVDEVREITDRASILRDGKMIETVDTVDTSHAGFVSHIIGRDLNTYTGGSKPAVRSAVKFAVHDLCYERIGPLSFDIAEGEIVGLTGLIGSGFDNIPALVYGAATGVTGKMTIGGCTHQLNQLTPARAMQSGIAYLPADRLAAAGVGSLSIADNIALPVLSRLRGALALTTQRINQHAAEIANHAGVRPNIPTLPLAALSGGNAQKALMAKWLQTDPSVLLLDEPTQGVDVGARQQLWDALDSTAANGSAILIASTDYEQLALLCHRVLIFSQGQVVATLSGSQLNKELIAEHCYRSMTHSA